MRHGEDDVEIVQRDQFARARLDPTVARLRLALGTVAIAAGVEGEAEIPSSRQAMVAVTAERRRAAAFDGAHDFMLRPGNARAAALDEASRVGSEDIGHLQRGLAHDAAGSSALAPGAASLSSGFGAERRRRVAR